MLRSQRLIFKYTKVKTLPKQQSRMLCGKILVTRKSLETSFFIAKLIIFVNKKREVKF